MFASKRNAAMLDEDLLPLTSRSSHRFKKLKSSQGDALAATLSSLDLSNPNPTPTFPPTVSLPSRRHHSQRSPTCMDSTSPTSDASLLVKKARHEVAGSDAPTIEEIGKDFPIIELPAEVMVKSPPADTKSADSDVLGAYFRRQIELQALENMKKSSGIFDSMMKKMMSRQSSAVDASSDASSSDDEVDQSKMEL